MTLEEKVAEAMDHAFFATPGMCNCPGCRASTKCDIPSAARAALAVIREAIVYEANLVSGDLGVEAILALLGAKE